MTKKIVDELNRIKKELSPNRLAEAALPMFIRNTPIDTGNARRHTRRVANVIIAEYPYAVRLDNGWSKQSPDGMVKPTIAAIRAYIKKTLGI